MGRASPSRSNCFNSFFGPVATRRSLNHPPQTNLLKTVIKNSAQALCSEPKGFLKNSLSPRERVRVRGKRSSASPSCPTRPTWPPSHRPGCIFTESDYIRLNPSNFLKRPSTTKPIMEPSIQLSKGFHRFLKLPKGFFQHHHSGSSLFPPSSHVNCSRLNDPPRSFWVPI